MDVATGVSTLIALDLLSPRQISLDPVANVAYVVGSGTAAAHSGCLWRIDLTTGAKTTILGRLDHPSGLLVSAERTRAYVSEPDTASVAVIDIASGARIGAVGSVKHPSYLTWAESDERSLYVVAQEQRIEILRLDRQTSDAEIVITALPTITSGIALHLVAHAAYLGTVDGIVRVDFPPPPAPAYPKDPRKNPPPATSPEPHALGAPILPRTLEAGQDCNNGIPVCQSSYRQNQSFIGPGGVQEAIGTCLLGGESNSVWYIFTAQTSGSLTFILNTARDYDFALYNITTIGCGGVPNATPIRCNYSETPGATGLVAPAQPETPALGVDSTGPPTMPGVNVAAGQTYALLVNNFSADSNGYTLTFGGTASIFDQTPPALRSASIDTATCQIEVATSEPVLCSSIAPDGSDFVLALPGGATVTSATGTTCGTFTGHIRLTYVLNNPLGACDTSTWVVLSKVGSDGNTLLDICGNALSPGQGVILPSPLPAVAKLTLTSNAVCDGAPVRADGSGSTSVLRHVWSVAMSDANGVVSGPECTMAFDGPAGTLDVVAFAKQHGCALTCNHYYRVKLSVIGCCNNDQSEASRVIRIQCPRADAGPDVCCNSRPPITLGTPGVTGLTYAWSPSAHLSDPASPMPQYVPPKFAVPGVQTYTLSVTDAIGCTASDTMRVFCGTPLLSVDCGGTACKPLLTAASRNSTSLSWSNGATDSSITPTSNGHYVVRSENPCGEVSAAVTVDSIERGPFLPLIFPNTFTPNGDGVNDVFEIFQFGIDRGARPAYNATGYRLYIDDNFDSIESEHLVAAEEMPYCQSLFNGQIRWDGRINGNLVQEGIYPWHLELKNCDHDYTRAGLEKHTTQVVCAEYSWKWWCLWSCRRCVRWTFQDVIAPLDNERVLVMR